MISKVGYIVHIYIHIYEMKILGRYSDLNDHATINQKLSSSINVISYASATLELINNQFVHMLLTQYQRNQ